MALPKVSRYLWIVLATFLIAVSAGAAINFVHDPFAVFRHPPKPGYFAYARLAKARAIERIRPQTIILGTSRAEIGLDPAFPGISARPAYNLSLGGANLHEIAAYLEHAQAVHPLKMVILELEFFTFNVARKPTPDFDPAALRSPDDSALVRLFSDLTPAFVDRRMFTFDMLVASLRSDPAGPPQALSYHRPDGVVEHAGARVQVASQGHFAMFGPPLKAMMESPTVYASYRSDDPLTGASTYLEFVRLLRFCRTHGIDLRIAITPSHALLYETIRRAGSWSAFELWQRELVRLVAEEAAAHPGARAFPLWDFSGYNSITTETVPEPGDKTSRMRWFWEAVHIKRETGDLVLARMLGSATPDVPEDFGIVLTVATLDAHLEKIRAAREHYVRHTGRLLDAVLK